MLPCPAFEIVMPRHANSISPVEPGDQACYMKTPAGKTYHLNVLAATDLSGVKDPDAVNVAKQLAGHGIMSSSSNQDAAVYIAEQFAARYPPSPATAEWGCIVGDGVSGHIPRASGRTFVALIDNKKVLLYMYQTKR